MPGIQYPIGGILVAGYIIIGTLAAFGALSLLWTLLGWLLPGGKGCVLVCFGAPDVGMVSRCRWLRGMGFLRCPLLAVEVEEAVFGDDMEICAGEDLLARLEWERNQVHGTGIGDPPGRHQRRGVSEL